MGRWLVRSLARENDVMAVLRSEASLSRTKAWLEQHEARSENISYEIADLSGDSISLAADGIRDIYNVAWAY